MHTRVAMEAGSLLLDDVHLPSARSLHKGFCDLMLRHGRIAFSSPEEARGFARAVREDVRIPIHARKRWEAILTQFHATQRVTIMGESGRVPLAALVSLAEMRANWSECVDLAVVPASTFRALGINDSDVPADTNCNPEVATAANALHAAAFDRLLALTEIGVFEHGRQRDEFWESVLAPLASGVQGVTVLDRYLANTAARSGGRPEHMAWLIDRISGVVREGAELHLITRAHSLTPSVRSVTMVKVKNFLETIWQLPSGGRLGRIRATVVRSNVQQFPHDRHIRFSSGGGVAIHAGFDRFSGNVISDADGVKWEYVVGQGLEHLRRRETRAVGLPSEEIIVTRP